MSLLRKALLRRSHSLVTACSLVCFPAGIVSRHHRLVQSLRPAQPPEVVNLYSLSMGTTLMKVDCAGGISRAVNFEVSP